MIEKKPFVKYDFDNKVDMVSLKLNTEERKQLETLKKILQQPKDATTIKQVYEVGAKVILDESIGLILQTILGNKRRNKRTGADVEFD
jgi:hypothetical protein